MNTQHITIDMAIRKLQQIKRQLEKNPPGKFKPADAGGFCLVLSLTGSGIETLPCKLALQRDQDGAVVEVRAKLPEDKCPGCKEVLTYKDLDGGRCLSCGKMIT